MSPLVFREGKFVFWFHSYDVLHESRASIHVGKGSQNDAGDAKIWLEPQVELARHGRTLREHELNRALRIIQQNHAYLLEEWHGYKRRAG